MSDGGTTIVSAWTLSSTTCVIVCESSSDEDISRVGSAVGGPQDVTHEITAVLAPDPRNRYQHNAISVRVGGRSVGWLPHHLTRSYAAVLAPLAGDGQLVSVPGRAIWRDRVSGDPWAQVSLDLPAPGLLLPGNAPPAGLSLELPAGGPLAVVLEADPSVITETHPGQPGTAAAYVSLHRVPGRRGGTRQGVEVRLDSRPIGRLASGPAAEYSLVLREAESLGVLVYARASIEASARSVAAEVWAPRARQLPAAWLVTMRAVVQREPTPTPGAAKSLREPGPEAAKAVLAPEPAPGARDVDVSARREADLGAPGEDAAAGQPPPPAGPLVEVKRAAPTTTPGSAASAPSEAPIAAQSPAVPPRTGERSLSASESPSDAGTTGTPPAADPETPVADAGPPAPLPPPPPPGWYPDPLGQDRDRFWDGVTWTDHVHTPDESVEDP